MGNRRRAREYALQMLYQIDLCSITSHEVFSTFWMEMDVLDSIRGFSEHLVSGIIDSQKLIDETISNNLDNWKLSRLSVVDRNILRIATYELLQSRDIPYTIILNEALELSREFSSDETRSLLNAVLHKVSDKNRSHTEEDSILHQNLNQNKNKTRKGKFKEKTALNENTNTDQSYGDDK